MIGNTLLSVPVALLLPNVVLGIFYPIRWHIYDKCGYTLDFQASVLLGYSVNPYVRMPTSWDCPVELQGATPGCGIQVRFRKLNTTYASDCHVTRLVVADGSKPLTPSNGVCGVQIPPTMRTRDNIVTITLRTDSSPSHYGDFDLLLTEFSYPLPNGSCNGTYFKCSNGICISSDLECNGYNDCDDNSDETEGCGPLLTVVVIIGIGVGGFCFVVIVCLLIGFLLYRRRRQNNASATTPSTNVWVTPTTPGEGYAKLH